MAQVLRQSRTDAAPALVLTLAAALCWAVSVDRMGAMGSGPSSAIGTHLSMGMRMSMGLGLRTNLGSLGWFTGMWTTMMAAMMLPSVVPAATLTHQRSWHIARGAAPPRRFGTRSRLHGRLEATGLLAYGVIDALHPIVPQWDHGGRYSTPAVLLAAAMFELSPLKANCLRMCRDWRPAAAHIRAKAVAVGGSSPVSSTAWCASPAAGV
ncbi:MAG: DUF2182 domain-containing protein [Solirubrobacteraceae bacterium]